MAGFVPHDGAYSKVGYDETAAKKGTVANDKGIADGFAGKSVLRLTMAELQRQRDIACENPPRTAMDRIVPIGKGDDLILVCTRPGDEATFNFLAHKREGAYDILILPRGSTVVGNSVAFLADRVTSGKIRIEELTPLYVMVSEEAGANRRPMTGDYDLMTVCPPWGDYMSRTLKDISKPAIQLNPGIVAKHAPMGQTFKAGTLLDKVLDMRLHTGAPTKVDFAQHYEEHGDMGNLTPRILRAINTLNFEMAAINGQSALRRVHHNAESHRNAAFGALTNSEMSNKGDGFPLTAFHPAQALRPGSSLVRYDDTVTILTMGEFRDYCSDVRMDFGHISLV